jgi:pilus assembly protein CpaE
LSSTARETLIVADGGVDLELVRSAVPPGSSRVVSLADGVEHALTALTDRPYGLLILSCVASSDGALELIREARRRETDCTIVVLYGGSPNGFMERAFQLGADDLITLPQPQEALSFALEKAIARRRGSTAPAALAPMICIVGPKGGTGKTLTADNLAFALARAGARPALVDIDLQFGDVGLALGLAPERTIYDLAILGGALQADTVGRFLTRHSSGVDALLAPVRPDQAGAIRVDLLRQVYESLRAEHDFLIVDTPPAFTPEVISTIDVSSHLCVVGMLDALSLKDTKIGLETLALMGRDLDELTLVLNRADTSVGIGKEDVERILGRRPDILVPSDRAIPRAITDGLPIVLADERSGAAQSFIALADIYLHEAPWLGQSSADQAKPGRTTKRSLLRKGR